MHLGGSGVPPLMPHCLSLTFSRNLSHTSKWIPQVGCYGVPGTAPSPIPPALKFPQGYLPTYSPQELVVLIGADLPPPIS